MIDDALFAELGELKPRLTALYEALEPGGSLADLPGWLEFIHRPTGLLRVDGVPVLVATLYGPSGAGKSTLFRMLTDIQVPAGAERRPTTYGCVVAIPASVSGQLDLGETFPGYPEVLHLDDPRQLADSHLPEGRLYWDTYPAIPGESAVALIADVPDINTFARDNWTRAEEMLARSEVVVFVCGPESYSDQRIIDQFRKALLKAGYLAYLFTKCTRREAEIKWDHLKELLGELDLSRSAVYHSEFSRQPALTDLRPLFGDPPLPELIQGADALEIRMASMEKEARLALRSLLDVSERALARQREIAQKIKRIDEACEIEAERIAESRQPVQEVLEILIRKAEQQRPAALNAVWKPVALLSKSVRLLAGTLKKLLTGRAREVREREEMEAEKLATAAQRLVKVLRVLDKHAVSATESDAALQAFAGHRPPPVSSDWEASIQEEADRWVAEHPAQVQVVAVLYDGLMAAGSAAIGIDLTLSGGLLSLSAGSAVGGAMMGGGKLLRLMVDKLGLGRVLEAAHRSWLEQRRSELAEHLGHHLADPLLRSELAALRDCLSEANPEDCRDRASALQRKLKQ